MNEKKVLNKTIDILNKEGAKEAYEFLIRQKGKIEESSQFYNFLYCLAALSDRPEKALSFLEEAIVDKKMWYRPEVFLDDDLLSIRDSERFINCRKISDARYKEAIKESSTIFTWKEKTETKLAIGLHGNQQNIGICKNDWKFLKTLGYQVEYVQSSEIDSQDLFRWEDNAKVQLPFVLDRIGLEEYGEYILCGFSAACNEILKSFVDYDINCHKLILVSPWIPIIEKEANKVVEALNKRQIEVILICGKEDEDCYPMALELAKSIKDNGGNIKTIFNENLGHEFPEDMETLLKKIL